MAEGAGRDWETMLATRHGSTQEKMTWFEYGHLPEGGPREVSVKFAALAIELIEMLSDGPQFTIALQKLVEAKDCAVRQAISMKKAEDS